jgi:hypothetical protein
VGLAALVLAPLLAWCSLRLAVVGHFGVVSFTGYNLIGLTASMLDGPLAARLPPSDRVLAGQILEWRRERGWRPVRAGSTLSKWRRPFNANSLEAGRAARALAEGDLPTTVPRARRRALVNVEADRRLTRLSLAVLRARPEVYLAWLRLGWRSSLAATGADPWVWVPALLLAASLVGAAGLDRSRRVRAMPAEAGRLGPGRPAWGLLLASLGYFLAALGLVLLVEVPYARYLAAAELLLPGALAATAVEVWVRRRGRSGGSAMSPLNPLDLTGDSSLLEDHRDDPGSRMATCTLCPQTEEGQ